MENKLKLKTLKEFNHTVIFYEALKLSPDSFYFIRETLLSNLEANPNLSIEQKVAIRLASKELIYMGASELSADQVILQILNTTWQHLGLDPEKITALSKEAYEMIIEGIMDISRNMLAAESARLQTISQLQTELPENWDELDEQGEDPEIPEEIKEPPITPPEEESP